MFCVGGAESLYFSTHHPLTPGTEALRARLVELLAQHDGNVSAVARAMGKARMQIHRWMKRFGLEPDQFRNQEP